MNIEKRILELLYFKDYVIIPGLGGFVSRYIPAKIREETQTFIPPSKEVGFNRDLLQDDGLLSGYIADCDNISITAARTLLDNFVDLLKGKISEGDIFRLKSIGYFSYSRTGELEFSASKEINFLTNSFGLSSFHFARPQPEEENRLLRTAIFNKRDTGTTISLPGTSVNHSQQRYLRRAVIAIPLIVVISLLPINSRNGLRNGQHPATLFPLTGQSAVDQTMSTQPSELSENNIQKTADPYGIISAKENQDEGSEQKPFDRNSPAIIAGSFSTEENADILKQDLFNKGYRPEIWQASNGFFRVVIQCHENMTKAQEALIELKEDLTNIDFWILQ